MLVGIDRNVCFAIDAICIIFYDQFVPTGISGLGIIDNQTALAVFGDHLTVPLAVDEGHVLVIPIVLWELAVDKSRQFEGRTLSEGLGTETGQPAQLIAVVVLFLVFQAL